jgi:hypothetical protein
MKYIKGFKYQLAEAESYQTSILGYEVEDTYYSLSSSGFLLAKPGFAWDGATGSIDTRTNRRGSLFHDIGCLMVAKGQLPTSCLPKINALFYEILKLDNMHPWRLWWHFKAVTAHFARGKKPSRREVLVD